MQISPGMEIISAALYFKKEKVLVISDLHLGYEEALQRKGVLVPKFQRDEIIRSLERILKKVKPKMIVINGDLKHEFGAVLGQEWKDVLHLIDFILAKGMQIIIIKGNHDPLTERVTEKRGVRVIREYQLGGALIVHGDEPVKKMGRGVKKVIIGHGHPAITFREGSKCEKYKCFLKGKWKSRELIVLPSFNSLLEGTDILKEELLSPFLQNINPYKVYVIHREKTFDFGKVNDIKKIKKIGSHARRRD